MKGGLIDALLPLLCPRLSRIIFASGPASDFGRSTTYVVVGSAAVFAALNCSVIVSILLIHFAPTVRAAAAVTTKP